MPDIITLGVLDLDAMELSDSWCVLGTAQTTYTSADAVFLATTSAFDGKTPIYQFDIDVGGLTYAGSGAVEGHLGGDPLRRSSRMSEKDGYLRVATFNDEQGLDASPIVLSVLQANGQGRLETVSTLPNSSQPAFIGNPGEQLDSSRFIGDRAYLKTHRPADPMYVIDLADPINPSIAGELEIEGYSDYLQPIGQDYVLGIGKDAVAANDGVGDGHGALVQGLKLSLFNVSNPTSPTKVQSIVIGERGTDAIGLTDHRAINIQPATDAHTLRVSFGVEVYIDLYGDGFTEEFLDRNSTSRYFYSFSGLHGFDVKVGADAEIISKGVLRSPEYAAEGVSDYVHLNGIFRSVMVNDALFYTTRTGVFAANWNDLASPSPAR